MVDSRWLTPRARAMVDNRCPVRLQTQVTKEDAGPTGVLSNEALYARCYVTPLSVRVSKFRWRMLGHILRGQEDSPAYTSMLFAINSDIFMEGRRGRPCLNLLDVIRKDLTRRNLDIRLKNLTDFEDLRFLALDREEWKKLEDG